MRFKFHPLVRSLLKPTSFWRDYYFILREFKHFPLIAVSSVIFTLLAAAFEGLGVGLILAFLQSLTAPNSTPIQTGIYWFDIWVLESMHPTLSEFIEYPLYFYSQPGCVQYASTTERFTAGSLSSSCQIGYVNSYLSSSRV